MLFNTHEFLLFFIIVFALYYTLPGKWIMPLLLVASAVFYCFFIPAYLLILLLVIGIDYTAAIAIEKNTQYKKWFLRLSIFSNLGILFFFKYYNFFIENCNHVFDAHWTFSHLILPIGLSFHTFQSLSYIIEVYRGKFAAEKNIGYFALYVLYFPQLVAGPIERPQNVLPQLKVYHKFQWENLLNGVRLVLWGLFKKAVIADRIAYYVADVFANTNAHTGFQVCVGILLFSIQIYCDFSGYSDMAIGLSKTLGIDLMINFNRPYFASNIQAFWQRWHISLSTWFRDYVYHPLGGSRVVWYGVLANVCIVFVLSGFWHGARWNFIAWGAIHAGCICLYILYKKLMPSTSNFLIVKIFYALLTFVIVSVCWVFFRAESMAQAMQVLHNAVVWKSVSFNPLGAFGAFSFGTINFGWSMAMIGFLFAIEYKYDALLMQLNKYKWLDILFLASLVLIILFTGVFTKQSFIYFQF
jgi:alginate O-acetyltransferase complex protein AlgI